jgi:hypothetical protein
MNWPLCLSLALLCVPVAYLVGLVHGFGNTTPTLPTKPEPKELRHIDVEV